MPVDILVPVTVTDMSGGSGVVNWSSISVVRLVDIDVELFNKRPHQLHTADCTRVVDRLPTTTVQSEAVWKFDVAAAFNQSAGYIEVFEGDGDIQRRGAVMQHSVYQCTYV